MAKSNFVFKVSAFCLDTRAQTGAPLSDCRINNTLVKFTVTSRWERRYAVKAVHMVDNSGSTSRSIISCLGPEIFVQINRILTKFCRWKLVVPVIMTRHVVSMNVDQYMYLQYLQAVYCINSQHQNIKTRLLSAKTLAHPDQLRRHKTVCTLSPGKERS